MSNLRVVSPGIVDDLPISTMEEALQQAKDEAIWLGLLSDNFSDITEITTLTQTLSKCANMIRSSLDDILHIAQRKLGDKRLAHHKVRTYKDGISNPKELKCT